MTVIFVFFFSLFKQNAYKVPSVSPMKFLPVFLHNNVSSCNPEVVERHLKAQESEKRESSRMSVLILYIRGCTVVHLSTSLGLFVGSGRQWL
jgi:hypothetical protein